MNPVPVLTIDGPSGSGKGTVARAVAEVERLWPGLGIRISAQSYLRRFYEASVSPGFGAGGASG